MNVSMMIAIAPPIIVTIKTRVSLNHAWPKTSHELVYDSRYITSIEASIIKISLGYDPSI